VVNSVSQDYDIHFAKPLDFLYVHTSNLFSGFLSRVEHLSLKFRRLKTNSLTSKFSKTTKISKTKFVGKPLLQNQQITKLPAIKTCPKASHFDH
jgi:hypothetical protein